jgi:hypothetical protein
VKAHEVTRARCVCEIAIHRFAAKGMGAGEVFDVEGPSIAVAQPAAFLLLLRRRAQHRCADHASRGLVDLDEQTLLVKDKDHALDLIEDRQVLGGQIGEPLTRSDLLGDVEAKDPDPVHLGIVAAKRLEHEAPVTGLRQAVMEEARRHLVSHERQARRVYLVVGSEHLARDLGEHVPHPPPEE